MHSLRSAGVAAVLGFVLLAGCASGGGNLQRLGTDDLFQQGMAAYEAGRWPRAVEALERFVERAPADRRVEEARYHLASARLQRGDHLMAAEEFQRVAVDFPTGQFVERARFGVCEAYYKLSPHVQLDQEYTRAAIDHCEALVTYYPNAADVPRAREIVTEMRNKLAEKLLLSGDFYFRRRAYDSSIVYFEDVPRLYPDSPAAPRALLRLVQAYIGIGYTEEAESARERLLRDYPDSAAAREVRDIVVAGSS